MVIALYPVFYFIYYLSYIIYYIYIFFIIVRTRLFGLLHLASPSCAHCFRNFCGPYFQRLQILFWLGNIYLCEITYVCIPLINSDHSDVYGVYSVYLHYIYFYIGYRILGGFCRFWGPYWHVKHGF